MEDDIRLNSDSAAGIVVLVVDLVWPRNCKIGYGLKSLGWHVVLLHKSPLTVANTAQCFDEIHTYTNPQEALELARRFHADIYHVFSHWGFDTAAYLLKSGLTPIIFDDYDILSGVARKDYIDKNYPGQIELERYCIENANGICCRDLLLQKAKHTLHYQTAGRVIYFPDYCWDMPFVPLPSDHDMDKGLHIAYVGGIAIEKHAGVPSPRNSFYLLDFAGKLAQRHIHFHMYPVPLAHVVQNFDDIFSDHLALARNTPFFHMNRSLPSDRLITELSRFDLGLLSIWRGMEYTNPAYEPVIFSHSDSNKNYDYIDAGLGVVTCDSLRLQRRYLGRKNICVSSYLDDVIETIDATPQMFWEGLKDRVKQARACFSIKRHMPRLTAFYGDVGTNNRKRIYSFTSSSNCPENKCLQTTNESGANSEYESDTVRIDDIDMRIHEMIKSLQSPLNPNGITWDSIKGLSRINLYAGDIPDNPHYDGAIGLSITHQDSRHLLHDITQPLPLPDNSVDRFQAEDVFEHIPYEKLVPVIDEIYRILKPNGTFRLSIPDYGCDILSKRSVKDEFGNIAFDPGGGGTVDRPGHLWFPRIDSVRKLLNATLFNESGEIGYLHYWRMDGIPVTNAIDYRNGYIQRTPDHDARVEQPYRPMSMVIDFVKMPASGIESASSSTTGLRQSGHTQLPKERHGTEYGGWWVCPDRLHKNSIVYSFGIGEDISFDLSMIDKYGLEIHAFDPTPRALAHVSKQRVPTRFHTHNIALAAHDGEGLFYPPDNPEHVSHTLVIKPQAAATTLKVHVSRLTTIMQDLGHDRIDLLKMDIEGSEYEVLQDILDSKTDVDQILVEFHHNVYPGLTADLTEEIISRLTKSGYALFSMEGRNYCFMKKHSHPVAGIDNLAGRKDAMNLNNIPDASPQRMQSAASKDETPVILITYNRPEHTAIVLDALRQQGRRLIYIFADGPKNASDLPKVQEVRALLKRIDWCDPVIVERTANIGLARSIVSAVNQVFEEHDQLILLEDDCVPQKHFFSFIEDCLDRYRDNNRVFGISGYTVPVPETILKQYPYDLYFFPRIGSWGWATWKRAWQHFEPDLKTAHENAIAAGIDMEQGGDDVPAMLNEMISGRLKDVWTLNWLISVYLKKGFYIYPTRSHIENIGMDGTGVHCSRTGHFVADIAKNIPERFPDDVILHESIHSNFRRYYDRNAGRKPKRKYPFKIVHLCMQDFGGAGNAAYRLHKGLQSIGIDSTMMVLNKRSGDPSVKVLPISYDTGNMLHCMAVDSFASPAWSREWTKWVSSMSQYPKRPDGLEMFSAAETDVRLELVREIFEADIINLHWTSGLVDIPRAPFAFRNKPVVWTLHDMNPFTGGCHYADTCKKYMSSCGACPQLGSEYDHDISHTAWDQKRIAYDKLNITIVTPSKWLGKCASKSSLFSKFPVAVIPNGFPIDIYKPYSKKEIRKALNISETAKVILFGADDIGNKRKGFRYLMDALNNLDVKGNDDIILLTFGNFPKNSQIKSKYPTMNLGSLNDQNHLAAVYSAADLFVLPALEDNLPNTVVESMACGTPVLGFNIGGIPDMVEHKHTGYLVKPKDVKGLIEGITWIISASAETKLKLSQQCRKKAEELYSLDVQANHYKKVYEELYTQEQSSWEEAVRFNKKGEEFFSGGHLDEAIEAFHKAVEIHSGFAMAHNNLGVISLKNGKRENALEYYKKAVMHDPLNITFLKNLADFYYIVLKDTEKALQIYIKGLSIHPVDIEILMTLGTISIENGQLESANDFYEKVLTIDPQNEDALKIIGLLTRQNRAMKPEQSDTATIELVNPSGGCLVSAIVSAYNSERFIHGCIEDLEAQSIADRLEIVIVDSCSPQNERAIVEEMQRKYHNIKYIRTDSRETVYSAWNRGIKAASGRYITNANTDDRHRRDAFEMMVTELESRPDIALVYADVIMTEKENETFERHTPCGNFTWFDWDRDKLLYQGCFMGPQPMWRRSVHDEYGYFDESMVSSGDYEFWLRISQTHNFFHIDTPLGLYLKSPQSIEHRNREIQREENRRILTLYRNADSKGCIIKSGAAKEIPVLIQPEFKEGMTSIIIPMNSIRLDECVASIRKYADMPHEVVFLDHGAAPKVKKRIMKSIKENPNYKVIAIDRKANFAQSINEGINQSTGEFIVLLFDDVSVCEGWLSDMLACLNSGKTIGIVGAMSDDASSLQRAAGIDFTSEEKRRSFRERNRHRNPDEKSRWFLHALQARPAGANRPF